MKRVFLLQLLMTLLFAEGLCAQGFKNPILPGFYPDPSICRADSAYYIVNSSFHFFPGVPIHRSYDLVNWEPVGHVLTRRSQLEVDGLNFWLGIYAPTIRYNNGRFYMVTTCVPNVGNFYVWSDDPAGEWSDPILVEKSGIDPDLFFDDDGKVYYTSTIDGVIYSCQIDIESGKKLTESRALWSGTGGRYPEAPHIYKRDGWYYLLISEGGTEYGHGVTIARSRSIWGPYQSNPANPILTHKNANAATNPIQGVGHADLVQATDGSWWLVALGFRPQSYMHHLMGRETFLAPVSWEKNAWPVVNGDGTISLEMDCPTLPKRKVKQLPLNEEFESKKISPMWHHICNPDTQNYSLSEREGWLRIHGSEHRIDAAGVSPSALLRRQQHINFESSTTIDLSALERGDEAGLSLYLAHNYQYTISVVRKGSQLTLELRYRLGLLNHLECSIPINERNITLKVEGTPDSYIFSYSTPKRGLRTIGEMNTRFLSSECSGGFTGVCLALYCSGRGYADFDNSLYKELPATPITR